MPPPNTPGAASPSPTRSAANPETPSSQRPLTPLSYLLNAGPDLATTLQTRAEDAADEANVSFLRDSLESLDQAMQQGRGGRGSRSFAQIDPQRDPRRNNNQPDTLQTAGARPSPWDSRQSSRPQESEQAEDLSRRERLQRVLARLNRLHEPSASSTAAYSNRVPSPNRQNLYDWAPANDDSSQPLEVEFEAILRDLRRPLYEAFGHANSSRVPSQSRLEGNGRQQRDVAMSGSANTDHLTEANERRERVRERERRRDTEWSLRNRAVPQSGRQEEVSGSPSATERMLRYVMDRERSGMSEEEERARGAGWFGPSPSWVGNSENRNTFLSRDSFLLPPPASELRERDRAERVEAFRRGYLAENVPPRLPRIATPPVPANPPPPPMPTMFLEEALKYLDELRSCSRYEEALSTALDHGLGTREFFADKHDDFIVDLQGLSPLPYSSWLQPGSVFEGHQHATAGGASLTHRRPSVNAHVVEQINPHFRGLGSSTSGFEHTPGSTRTMATFDAGRPWLSHHSMNPSSHLSFTKRQEASHDHWPVRVVIHAVDTQKMTLQGTMEAYDVPQHPSSLSIINSIDRPKAGKKHAPITTYLEGHIIDLRTHSFLTPGSDDGKKKYSDSGSDRPRPRPTAATTSHRTISDRITFPAASSGTDACNWRKLPPFNQMSSDEEVGRAVLSKARLEAINQEYIFMRWKERCFVHGKDDKCPAPESDRGGDQDRGHGLTISGFYYVSLRRSDGSVEGLYFDPSSTPYQHLRLGGVGRGWGAFEFR